MGRRYKIKLWQALELIGRLEPIGSTELVRELNNCFGCSDRTSRDVLTVFRRGQFVETTSPWEAEPDGRLIESRRQLYRLSERGRYLVGHPRGGGVLRLAQRLFTGTPSANVRRYQRSIAASVGLEQELADRERGILLSPLHPIPPMQLPDPAAATPEDDPGRARPQGDQVVEKRRRRKVDLFEALELIAMAEPIGHCELVAAYREAFRCSERRAEDAITVLRRVRYVEAEPVAGPESNAYDCRRALYCVSDRGAVVLEHPRGPFVLSAAWRLFTGTPSEKTRRYQTRIRAERTLEAELARIENKLLEPAETYRLMFGAR